jgi:arylsulfatase
MKMQSTQLHTLNAAHWRLAAAFALMLIALPDVVYPQQQDTKKTNILVIFGDDIGQTDVSAYSMGLMGFHTPNIDRVAKEGMIFTDYYAEQSCTAGRSTFITGQCTLGSVAAEES